MESNNSVNYENSVMNHKSGKDDDFVENNHVNGLSNGYNNDKNSKNHKSDHHKDKHKDRDKHRSKDHKSSSSSASKDKHKHSSHHKSSNKDKDRSEKREDRHKDKKSGERSEKSNKERSGDKDRSDRDKERGDKDRSDRDKERGDKDKEKGDKDKERSEKHRDDKKYKEKEHKSSKDKDKSRDKEGRDKDKYKHSSSRDKDKHSSRDKHRDKDKHSSSKDKKEKDKKVESYEPAPARIEEEKPMYDYTRDDSMDEDEQKLVIKEETESHDEEEQNNISQASSCDYSMSQFKDEPKQQVIKDEEPEDEDSDEDIPLRKPFSHKHRLAARLDNSKRKIESDEEDEVPLTTRKKIKKEKKDKKSKKRNADYDEEVDFKPVKKEIKKKIKTEDNAESPRKKKKKVEETQEVWKWWEEEKKEDRVKWTFLEHKGPVFAPPYERLPSNVKFYYDGQEMRLSDQTEEVAGFYARMLDHDYTTKDIFNTNFFKDWRRVMNEKERSKITDLKKCNFNAMHAYYMDMAERNRNRTKEEKAELKTKNEETIKEYGFCVIDGHKEKIGNFKIEPPGLFRGRGEHPKMGKLKRRVLPEDILINCSKDSKIPKPPSGHKWKEVRHDSSVTWLASWTENVQNQVKYVMLNPSSKLKGEKDWQKYETARRLHKCIDKIRKEYRDDWKSKEMRIRQRAVALYFIDKLALRAGNEKDEDQADTVGCCSLRVEHIELQETKDDKDYVVIFDFLGKDSIRYYNEVPVEKRVFKNLQLFMENKAPTNDLFDRLNTTIMNKHLNELMEGLTAKVFRTYNASFTLQQQLEELTNAGDSVSEKILSYNRANRAVAILCNHQRSVPKSHEKSMEKLKEKIQAKKEQIQDAERQVKDAQRDAKHGSVKEKVVYDKKKKMLQRLKEQLVKLTVQETDRDENKTIALGTSKLNYLDPRISVAWCKKYDVPIEKIYNKTQRDKFRWAIDMAGPDYVF